MSHAARDPEPSRFSRGACAKRDHLKSMGREFREPGPDVGVVVRWTRRARPMGEADRKRVLRAGGGGGLMNACHMREAIKPLQLALDYDSARRNT